MPEYIEREALIHYLTSPTGFRTNCKDCTDIYYCMDCIVEKAIRNSSAADVAPVRHGRWEYYDTYMDGTTVFRCSYCGDKQNGRNGWGWKKNFCPNCGAIMDLK